MPFKSAGRVIRTVTLGTEIKLDPSLILAKNKFQTDQNCDVQSKSEKYLSFK